MCGVLKPNLAVCSSDLLTFDIPTQLARVLDHLFTLSRHKPDEDFSLMAGILGTQNTNKSKMKTETAKADEHVTRQQPSGPDDH